VLTDLCCTAEEYGGPTDDDPPSWTQRIRGGNGKASSAGPRFCAHHGMLEAAMTVALKVEDLIEEELAANPEYSLVLVGHSLGGGVAALLATLWETKFPDTKAYLFGGPCVAPLYSHPTNRTSIINVINEGDPFRCMSLGHVADVSAALAKFCEEPGLRRLVLMRTDKSTEEMEEEDLQFCWETMEDLRNEVMTNADKMFPPGRIFHVSKLKASMLDVDSDDDLRASTDDSFESSNNPLSGSKDVLIHEVKPSFFQELIICPRMFDISRHRPSLYEGTLRKLIEKERAHQPGGGGVDTDTP
jgi:hypothetical protein